MKRYITMRYPTTWHGEMWREGTPCGNGTVGALVYGSIGEEIILLNHAGLWRGGKVQEMPDISDCLPTIRRYLDERQPTKADPILRKAFEEKNYHPGTTKPLPLGDLRIERTSQAPHKKYRRVIDLERAEVTVSWQENDVSFSRRTFVSREDGLFYTLISADQPGRINVNLSLTEHDRETLKDVTLYKVESHTENDYILYAGENVTAYKPAQGDYGITLRAKPFNGTMTCDGKRLFVRGADSLLLVASIFVGAEREQVHTSGKNKLASLKDYEKALAEHTVLHKALYNRVDFSLSEGGFHSNEELLLSAYDQEMSPELAETMYAFGRYLFICSTGEDGELPVHLTGLWNGHYQGFWAYYMFNVNFEMIYWNALSGNMPSLLRGALAYIENFLPDFRENARKIYGCRGIYLDSVNTPESGLAACLSSHILNWTAGGAWVSQHFYDYWRYTGDEAFLREHALPFMSEVALFYEDFLKTDERGKLVFAPATSPENVSSRVLKESNNSGCQCSRNPSMDIALTRELLTNLLEGSAVTGLYADKRTAWENMLAHLPDYKVNPDGSLREWADDFYDDNTVHRHQSHMYAIFPGHSIDIDDPLFPAFVKAENRRFNEGLSQMSSWGMVYMAGVYARMQLGDKALSALSEMVRNCCMNNLFTVGNDWRRMGDVMCDDMRVAPFQIDANIGFPGVVNEMLLGSADGELKLFPALPRQWEKGHLNGLLTVGGCLVDLAWENGNATVTIAGNEKPIEVVTGPAFRFVEGTDRQTISGKVTLKLIAR